MSKLLLIILSDWAICIVALLFFISARDHGWWRSWRFWCAIGLFASCFPWTTFVNSSFNAR